MSYHTAIRQYFAAGRALDDVLPKARMVKGQRYPVVDLYDYDRKRSYPCPVHKVVAYSIWGEEALAAVVRHLNDVPTDNEPTNLALGTQKDNAADRARESVLASARASARTRAERYRSGTRLMGRGRFNWEQMKSIARRYDVGETLEEIARDLGVSDSTVSRVVLSVKEDLVADTAGA